MKYFLFLLAPLLTTASFASGYVAKWWKDDVTARSAFEVRFGDAVQQVAKQFKPLVVSGSGGTVEVRAICVTEPCGMVEPIAATEMPAMIAVTEDQWDGLMYVAHVFQTTNPELYAEAYHTGSTYPIGHAEGSISVDW